MKCSQVLKKGGSGYNWTKALSCPWKLPSMATIAWGTQAKSCLWSAHGICPCPTPYHCPSSYTVPVYTLQPHPFWVSACSATFPNPLDWTPPPIDWDLQPNPAHHHQITEHKVPHLNSVPKATWGDWRILSRGIMPTHLMFGKVMLTSVQGMKEEMLSYRSWCINLGKYTD